MQVIGDFFKDHVDLSHSEEKLLSAGDNALRHSKLKLVNIVPELSGSYKCRVSTFLDEDFKQRDMIIYGTDQNVKCAY